MRSFYAEGAPPMLRAGAVAQALEAAGLVAVAVATAVEAVRGRSSSMSNGFALAMLELVVAAGVAWMARAIAQLRPWSRTPAVMTQLLCGVIGIILLQGHQAGVGALVLLVALVGLAGLLHPASLQALSRHQDEDEPTPATPAKPGGAKPGGGKAGAGKPGTAAKPGAAKPGPAGKPGAAKQDPAKGAAGKQGAGKQGAGKGASSAGQAAAKPAARKR